MCVVCVPRRTGKTSTLTIRIIRSLNCSTEKEFEEKLNQLQAKHAEEFSALGNAAGEDDSPTAAAPEAATTTTTGAEESSNDAAAAAATLVDPEEEARQRKLEKARRKREKQREKEQQREREIAEETANAGPSPRDVENAQILERLAPLNLEISEVAADGHCLYRAVAAQLTAGQTYSDVRALCAQTLQAHADEFSPFCEYTETAPDFEAYVDQVRSSAEWGGHLELRALSLALAKQVHVYSAQSPTALIIGQEEVKDDENPIRLSYHLHYYALGEHYNQVIPKS